MEMHTIPLSFKLSFLGIRKESRTSHNMETMCLDNPICPTVLLDCLDACRIATLFPTPDRRT